MPRPWTLALVAALIGAAPVQGQSSKPAAEGEKEEVREKKPLPVRVRGVTISCQTWGREWGTDAMLAALDRVKRQGGTWVAIHPYARIHADGRVTTRLGTRAPRWISRPLREARRRGLKVFVIPHLAYWGSGFSWRGAITFRSEASWRQFFRGYRVWIVKLAKMCREADAFGVGCELGGTVRQVRDWRRIIAAIRKVTRAPLTYAANWDRYQDVPFWGDLDLIGIQAYFPLVAHRRLPAPGELSTSWASILRKVGAYARRQKRKVVFTELGYDRSVTAAREPWKPERGGAIAKRAGEEVQVRCMRAALRALRKDRTVVGAFLWKAFAGPAPGEDFLVTTPAMSRVIRQAWRVPPKKEAPPGPADRRE